jgi:hypothetical protein
MTVFERGNFNFATKLRATITIMMVARFHSKIFSNETLMELCAAQSFPCQVLKRGALLPAQPLSL